MTPRFSPVEQFMLDAVAEGQIADAHKCRHVKTHHGLYGVISASSVRTVLGAASTSPHGLWLGRAHFTDLLNLADMTYEHPVVFTACVFENGIDASRSELGALTLRNCMAGAHHSVDESSPATWPALDLTETHISYDVLLWDCHVSGLVCLRQAVIGGRFDCIGGQFESSGNPALTADNLMTGGGVSLTGRFTSDSEIGTICFPGAHIGGQFYCGPTQIGREQP